MEEENGRDRREEMKVETARMLRNVQDYCFTIYTRAEWTRHDIEVIQQRPEWKTAAEDDMLDAINNIDRAKAALLIAYRAMKDKPVEKG